MFENKFDFACVQHEVSYCAVLNFARSKFSVEAKLKKLFIYLFIFNKYHCWPMTPTMTHLSFTF